MRKIKCSIWNKVAALCSGFIFLCFIAKAQNLVPNGNFENYSQCPQGNSGPITNAIPWFTANANSNLSVAFYDTCSSSIYVGAPLNFGGDSYQIPHSGGGYAALQFYGDQNYRQYIEVKLNDTLKIGHCYHVSFYVSLMSFSGVACNNIAAHFSDTMLQNDDVDMLINTTQDVLSFGNPVINDTSNWIQVSGIYVANGGENYITIGDFATDTQTDTTWRNGPIFDHEYATYYLDDVSVEEVTAQIPKAYAGNDTAINQGDSVFIGSLINGLSTQWFDGNGNAIATNVPGLWVHPSVPTDYILQQTVCGFTTIDTVHIDVWPLGIKNSKLPQVNIYPNPTSGLVSISLPKGGNWQVRMSDMQGRDVNVADVRSEETLITLQFDAAPGIYLVHVMNANNGDAQVFKLTVQN